MQISFSEPNQWSKFDVTVEGICTIKGCKHMKSDKWEFIAFPTYLKRDKDGVAQKNSKTGKDLYISDYSLDKAFETQVLAAYKAAQGAPATQFKEEDLPF